MIKSNTIYDDLKQVIPINKLSDVWEKEIDSKMDMDWWSIMYHYNWNDVLFIIDENIKHSWIDKLNDRLH